MATNTLRDLIGETVADMVMGHGQSLGFDPLQCDYLYRQATVKTAHLLDEAEYYVADVDHLIEDNESIVLIVEKLCFTDEVRTEEDIIAAAVSAISTLYAHSIQGVFGSDGYISPN